ncbi:MAG: hypothetical protein F6K09_13185 [Merismopedia sp. SIO2A8]|nr:hypothetical protein [Merismopedia sp. SIO2A8]
MRGSFFFKNLQSALFWAGWTITDDPYKVLDRVKFQIDLAAERVIAAEKNNEKIAVEIKSFLNPPVVTWLTCMFRLSNAIVAQRFACCLLACCWLQHAA